MRWPYCSLLPLCILLFAALTLSSVREDVAVSCVRVRRRGGGGRVGAHGEREGGRRRNEEATGGTEQRAKGTVRRRFRRGFGCKTRLQLDNEKGPCNKNRMVSCVMQCSHDFTRLNDLVCASPRARTRKPNRLTFRFRSIQHHEQKPHQPRAQLIMHS